MAHHLCTYSEHQVCLSHPRATMARGIEGNEMSTPKATPDSAKPRSSSAKSNQKSLLGFFAKQAQPQSTTAPTSKKSNPPENRATPLELTPAPSSNSPEISSPTLPSRTKSNGVSKAKVNDRHGLPLPTSPTSSAIATDAPTVTSSPPRKVRCSAVRQWRILLS